MPILPFPSLLDAIKEKGVKKAVYEGVDDVIERITAGMNIRDMRETLRGEEPSRHPNPRMKSRINSFLLHTRPRYFHKDVTGIYPTFRLGWLCVYLGLLEAITGIFLMIWYTPSPDAAYSNMLHILGGVPFGQLMRDLHRLGAEAMVVVVALHMLRTFFTASYKKPRQFTWFTGVILLIATLFLSFSGYLLPWDQLSLWAVTIGVSMIEAAPPDALGANLNLLLRGGVDIGANGLLRFYMLHVIAVPALMLVFTGVHYYKVVLHGHSLPPKSEAIGQDTAKKIPPEKRVHLIPDVLTRELMWASVTTLILLIACIWFYHAPLENHADPQNTPFGTTAPWYFLWIQGALKMGDKVLWGVFFPAAVFIFLLALPYLDLTTSRRYAHRRFILSVGFLMIAVFIVLTYMGSSEYGVETSADQMILHEMLHEPAHSKVGMILPIPFDQLTPGVYTTRELDADNHADAMAILQDIDDSLNGTPLGVQFSSELRAVYNDLFSADARNIRFNAIPPESPELSRVIKALRQKIKAERSELQNGWGAIIITPNQADLVRVDVVIVWETASSDDSDTPVYAISTGHTFIHRSSAYFTH